MKFIFNIIKRIGFIPFMYFSVSATLILWIPFASLIKLLLFCIFMPLYLSLFVYVYSNKISVSYIMKTYVIFYFVSILLFSVFVANSLDDNNIIYVKIYDLICFEDFVISFDVYFNFTTIIMFFVVISISWFVSIFSIWYMYKDPNFLKFISLLTCFSFFMVILVCSNNIIFIFVGWEGIGIFSYFLINFWNTRTTANRSALKAIVFNKVGDCFLYLFIFLYWFLYKTFSIYEPINCTDVSRFDFKIMGISCNGALIIFLVVAAMAKSAQMFLHVWLPDAMEGPTPVSALLHAATMVTAGVFVLIRFNHLLDYNTSVYKIVMWVGLLTNFIASFTAIFQNDIKKIIAYSTASQIGIIFASVGIFYSNLALYHIYNHAFFKAFLFIMAGVIIHFSFSKQDLRLLKKINTNNYVIYVCFIICAFSLSSIPFFSGYFSKETIIHAFTLNENYLNTSAFYLFNISAITTAIYTAKIIYYIYYSDEKFVIEKNIKNFNLRSINDWSTLLLYIICALLMLFTVFSGYLAYEVFVNDVICFSSEFNRKMREEYTLLLFFIEVTSLYYIFAFIWGVLFWTTAVEFAYISEFDIFLKKFFFNELNRFVILFCIPLSHVLSIFFDKQIVEAIVSNLSKLDFDIENYPTVYFKIEFIGHLILILEFFIASTIIPLTATDFFIFIFLLSQANWFLELTDEYILKIEKKE